MEMPPKKNVVHKMPDKLSYVGSFKMGTLVLTKLRLHKLFHIFVIISTSKYIYRNCLFHWMCGFFTCALFEMPIFVVSACFYLKYCNVLYQNVHIIKSGTLKIGVLLNTYLETRVGGWIMPNGRAEEHKQSRSGHKH